LLVGLLSTSASAAAPVAAAGGIRILENAMKPDRLLAVGVIQAPTKIDRHGYAADLVVEQALSGHVHMGETLRIAWEELAERRPVRLSDKGRVLVCLEAQPDYSLWKKRFPPSAGTVWAICEEGNSFLRSPEKPSTYLLRHYMELGSAGFTDPAGEAYLARLVAEGQRPLAFEALHILSQRTATLTDRGSIDPLLGAAANVDKPRDLRQQAFLVLGHRKANPAREGLNKLTAKEFDLRASAINALALLDKGIDDEKLETYLSDPNPEVRGVAALFAGKDQLPRLRKLMADDPEGLVRAVIVHRLIEIEGEDGIADVLPRLSDEDDKVRVAAAREIGRLGAPAVPFLDKLAREGSLRDAQGAIAALTYTEAAGLKTVRKIAADHPNKKIRAMAELALGKAPDPDPHSH
jgi:HEAT repeat protein